MSLQADDEVVRSRTGTPATRTVVMVSTAPPRRCGLAVYTDDLVAALAAQGGSWNVLIAAVDRDDFHYHPPVSFVIQQEDAASYRQAADAIAAARADLVLIEHEYGIFGGPDGRHLLELTHRLQRHGIAYILTLHTVLSQPTPGQATTLRLLCAGAAGITVFSDRARRRLAASGVAADDRVAVMRHGAPAVMRVPPLGPPANAVLREVLAEIGSEPVLCTFGLIGPGKGLELVIEGLPAITAAHPTVRYVIAGATHPEVLKQHGEAYRDALCRLAADLGVLDRLHFVNEFLSEADISRLLARTTIYVTPYRGMEQTSSGTLAFALAAGCPVVSTPYEYAVEMLATSVGAPPGALVPPGRADAIAAAVVDLLDRPEALSAAQLAARAIGAETSWPAVAQTLSGFLERTAVRVWEPGPPPLRIDHLDRLTDRLGIIQFAIGATPDPSSGTCVDDMARLAIVSAGLLGRDPGRRALYATWVANCVGFLEAAVAGTGMHNMADGCGRWLDEPHHGDHVGRALWAAGVMAACDAVQAPTRHRAARLVEILRRLCWPGADLRTCAYAVLGLTAGRSLSPADRAVATACANRLVAALADNQAWQWFEPWLTYDNARLTQALVAAAGRLGEPKYAAVGLAALRWYLGQVGLAEPSPRLCLVGNRWRLAGTRSDQEGAEQPLDAAAVVEALVAAWHVTGDEEYAQLATIAFDWFHGNNRAGLALYDAETGGCRDGLSENGVSANEGAESTLAYHQALLALSEAALTPRSTQSVGWRPDGGGQPGWRVLRQAVTPSHLDSIERKAR